MKILQLISSAGFFGAESVVLELSKELNSQNIENIIGVFENFQNPHAEIAQYAKENNLKATVFECNGKVDLKTLYDIKRFIKKNEIDIIHTHGYKSNIYGILIAKILKKPIISTCHNWISDDLKTKTYYRIDKFMLPKFNEIIAVSDEIENELLRNKVQKNKITLIFNGINISKFSNNNRDVKSEFNISNGTKIIGTIARFTPEKGLFNFLQAAKEISNSFPDVIFMFVGDGPLREDLAKKTVELGIREKVIFTGIRNDMPEVYNTIDIFVLPSLKEGLPMVLLEAMAAKKPVIATKVGAIPKVIEDKKEGILTSPDSVEELKDAITYLLKNKEFSEKLSKNAYDKVSREFSSKIMCERYLEIYKEVIQNKI